MPRRKLRCIHFDGGSEYLGKCVYILKGAIPTCHFLFKFSPWSVRTNKYRTSGFKGLEYRMPKTLAFRWHEHQIILAQRFVNLSVIQWTMKDYFYIGGQRLK